MHVTGLLCVGVGGGLVCVCVCGTLAFFSSWGEMQQEKWLCLVIRL